MKIKNNLIIDGTIQHSDGGVAGEVFFTDGTRGNPSGTIVSTDADNDITIGGDGGAYLDLEYLDAFFNAHTLNLTDGAFINEVVDTNDFVSKADATGADIVLGRFTNGSSSLKIKKAFLDSATSKFGGYLNGNLYLNISSNGDSNLNTTILGKGFTNIYILASYSTDWYSIGYDGQLNFGNINASTPESSANVIITSGDNYRVYQSEVDLPTTGEETTLYYIRGTQTLKGWTGSAYADIGGGGGGTMVSADANNAITAGSDSGAYLDTRLYDAVANTIITQRAYHLYNVIDNADLETRLGGVSSTIDFVHVHWSNNFRALYVRDASLETYMNGGLSGDIVVLAGSSSSSESIQHRITTFTNVYVTTESPTGWRSIYHDTKLNGIIPTQDSEAHVYVRVGDGMRYYNAFTDLPTAGHTGTLYKTRSDCKLYIYDGAQYKEFSTGGGSTIVSGDADNDIIAGGDGGAFISLDWVKGIADGLVRDSSYLYNVANDYSDLATRANATGYDVLMIRTIGGSEKVIVKTSAMHKAMGTLLFVPMTGGSVTTQQDMFMRWVDARSTGTIELATGWQEVFSSQKESKAWSITADTSLNLAILPTQKHLQVYKDVATFPTTGDTETIYRSQSEGVYIWNGSTYEQIGGGSSTIVSEDANNDISAGLDGGAYLDTSPFINRQQANTFLFGYLFGQTKLKGEVQSDFSDLATVMSSDSMGLVYIDKTTWLDFRFIIDTSFLDRYNPEHSDFVVQLLEEPNALPGNSVCSINKVVVDRVEGAYTLFKSSAPSSSMTRAEVQALPIDTELLTFANRRSLPQLGETNNVEFYADVASLPVTGVVDTLYIAKAENSLHEWNGSAYDELGDGNTGEVNNVEFYDNVASLPATGTADILYIAKAENTLHEWNGSSYDLLGGNMIKPTQESTAPTSVVVMEGNDVKYITPIGHNILMQTILNKTTVTGAVTSSIVNPDFGTVTLSNNDMQPGKSYKGEIIGWIQTPDATSYSLNFKVGATIFTLSMPQFDASTRKPLHITFNIDFLDGIDTARRFIVQGVVFSENVIKIFDNFGTDDIKTVDATNPLAFDIEYVGTNASQEITINKINLNRNR